MSRRGTSSLVTHRRPSRFLGNTGLLARKSGLTHQRPSAGGARTIVKHRRANNSCSSDAASSRRPALRPIVALNYPTPVFMDARSSVFLSRSASDDPPLFAHQNSSMCEPSSRVSAICSDERSDGCEPIEDILTPSSLIKGIKRRAASGVRTTFPDEICHAHMYRPYLILV